jgi:hypothetical protein
MEKNGCLESCRVPAVRVCGQPGVVVVRLGTCGQGFDTQAPFALSQSIPGAWQAAVLITFQYDLDLFSRAQPQLWIIGSQVVLATARRVAGPMSLADDLVPDSLDNPVEKVDRLLAVDCPGDVRPSDLRPDMMLNEIFRRCHACRSFGMVAAEIPDEFAGRLGVLRAHPKPRYRALPEDRCRVR